MSVPIVKLEWNGDPAPFYCPVCGKVVFDVDSDEDYCKHIIFTYIDVVGEYESIPEHLLEKAGQYLKENGTVCFDCEPELIEYCMHADFFDFLDALSYTIDSPSAFIISLTTNGMACGPCSCTPVIGVDFKPEK